MRSIPLWGTLLALWIGLGIWFFRTTCCGSISNPLSIMDGATSVAASPMNLMYGLAGAVPLIPGEVKGEFGKVAAYLADHPDRKLNIAGHYLASEENTSSFENLGLARAAALKDSLIAMGVNASRIGIAGVLKNDKDLFFDDEKNIYGGMDYSFGDMFISRSIHFLDGDNHNNKYNDNLRFENSGFKTLTPISDELTGTFKTTADYLIANPGRSIDIKGYYMESEKNTSLLQNLGLGRANTIKSMFMEMGVPAKQIATSSELYADLARDGANIVGGATYSFFDTPATNNKLADVEARLRKAPLVLYFETNSDNINLNASQRAYMADLIYYLDNKAGAKANSVGHTDNKGSASLNRRLSRKRAEFVRDYLAREGGIKSSFITTKGEGPNVPVADNDTPEGRAKNRRVEISIK